MRTVRIVSRILFAIGLVLVVTLSLTSPGGPARFEIWDKAQHALAYWALAFAGLLSFPGRRATLFVCLALFLLGAGLEFGQMFIGGRVASLADAAANAIGICAGLASVMVLTRMSAALRRPATIRRDS